jgi:rod shape-determining protein MreC
MADRVKALGQFETRTPSKMIAARIIGTSSGSTNRVAFVDRGSTGGVEKGMAVVTPDGIVGKVMESYPTASQVLMVDDPGFAAGVISQKNHVRGILMGLGHGKCKIEYIPNEEHVEVGELFFTTGDDRVFPKGMPAGKVTSIIAGATDKRIAADPVGLQAGPEEVLVVIQGVHQPIPDVPPSPAVYMGTAPPEVTTKDAETDSKPPVLTDADRLREKYKSVGEAQGHKFGEGTPGSLPPNFNLNKQAPPARAPEQPKSSGEPGVKPANELRPKLAQP